MHKPPHLPTEKQNTSQFPGAAGLDVRASDILKGKLHDVTTPEGFMLALKGVLRLRYNGLLWLGVPCNRKLGIKLKSCFHIAEFENKVKRISWQLVADGVVEFCVVPNVWIFHRYQTFGFPLFYGNLF